WLCRPFVRGFWYRGTGSHASFFFSSRRRHTRFSRDWSSDVCSSDLGFTDILLLLSEININRYSFKVIYFTEFIFYITFVWIFDILWQIGKKHKLRNSCWYLHTIFNFYVFIYC